VITVTLAHEFQKHLDQLEWWKHYQKSNPKRSCK